MKYIYVILISILFGRLAFNQSLSPDLISSAGELVDLPEGGTLSWSLGEPVIEIVSDRDFTLTQGFQQPFLGEITSFQEPSFEYHIAIFPNPVSQTLFLKTDYGEKLKYKILTLDGKSIKTDTFQGQINIALHALPAGNYILSLNVKKQLVKALIFEKL